MGANRSKIIDVRDNIASKVNSYAVVFDLLEFWIAGVIGLAVFGAIFVTTVHGGLPWECEEHFNIVSGAANLGVSHSNTSTQLASQYECEYMTSTASFKASGAGMCGKTECTDPLKETICLAHEKSLGCKWYAAGVTPDADTQTPKRWNSADCDANKGCCLYQPPATDEQMHDVCYSIDQYVQDEHYPNFAGEYKDQVKDARTYAILGYAFGFTAFVFRVLFHLPFLTNSLFSDKLARDRYVRIGDLIFLVAAFVFTILTFTTLHDVLLDNRKHLWGKGGVFSTDEQLKDEDKQLTPSTGFYAVAVYATLLGVNVVWFIGVQVGIIPEHPTMGSDENMGRLVFASEHA